LWCFFVVIEGRDSNRNPPRILDISTGGADSRQALVIDCLELQPAETGAFEEELTLLAFEAIFERQQTATLSWYHSDFAAVRHQARLLHLINSSF
jgi:hypothetical protein